MDAEHRESTLLLVRLPQRAAAVEDHTELLLMELLAVLAVVVLVTEFRQVELVTLVLIVQSKDMLAVVLVRQHRAMVQAVAAVLAEQVEVEQEAREVTVGLALILTTRFHLQLG
jgi:hypothetical protein